MPAQLDIMPPQSIPLVGPDGRIDYRWYSYLSRLGELVRGNTERWTTANRPTNNLYPGRFGWNTTLSQLEAWTGSSWVQFEVGSGSFLPLTGGTMSGAIAMGSSKITGLAAGTTNGDALRYEQLIGAYLLLTGGTMAGNIAMGSNKLTGLAAGSTNGDSVRYEQLGGASATELGYVVGVTSAIQTQLDTISGATGSLTLESSQDATSQTTVAFTGIASGKDYVMVGAALKTSDDDEGVRFQVGDSGGYKSTTYHDAFRILRADGTTADQNSTTDTAVRMTYESSVGNGVGNASNESMRFTIEFSGDDMASTSLNPIIDFHGSYLNSAGNLISILGGSGSWRGGTGALDRIQILTENGNGFASGTITLWSRART